MDTFPNERRWSLWLAAGLAVACASCDERAGAPEAGAPRTATGSGAAAAPATHEDAPAPEPRIALEVAALLDAPGGTLSFALKNLQERPFETTPVGTNHSRILITTPDGRAIEHTAWKDGLPPVVVEGLEQKSWTMDMRPILELLDLRSPGIYRVGWRIGETRSQEVPLLKEGS